MRFSGISRTSEVGRSDVPVHEKQIARTWASVDDDVGQKRIGVVNGKWVTKPCRVRSGTTVNNYTRARLCRDVFGTRIVNRDVRYIAKHVLLPDGKSVMGGIREAEARKRDIYVCTLKSTCEKRERRAMQGREYINELIFSPSTASCMKASLRCQVTFTWYSLDDIS